MFSLKASHAGAQGAHAADDEVDLHAGLGGGVEGADGLAVEQRIHLGDDVGGAAGAGMLGFAGDEGEDAGREGDGRDEQRERSRPAPPVRSGS